MKVRYLIYIYSHVHARILYFDKQLMVNRKYHLHRLFFFSLVRRAAVTSIGFLLMRTPEQVPSAVALLCESFHPFVRHGAVMALGSARYFFLKKKKQKGVLFFLLQLPLQATQSRKKKSCFGQNNSITIFFFFEL